MTRAYLEKGGLYLRFTCAGRRVNCAASTTRVAGEESSSGGLRPDYTAATGRIEKFYQLH